MATYGTTDRLTGGTASACGFTTFPSANAVDNNEGTYWSHVLAGAHWWEYDCGAGVTWAFGKLRIKNVNNYGINGFNVTGSINHADYTTLYTGNKANGTAWEDFTWLNTVAYRYLKINITSGYDAGEVNVFEFEAFEQLATPSGFFIFLSEAFKRNKDLWTPKLLLPKEEYVY